MEKSEGRKSASQDTSENGMENPGLELMEVGNLEQSKSQEEVTQGHSLKDGLGHSSLWRRILQPFTKARSFYERHAGLFKKILLGLLCLGEIMRIHGRGKHEHFYSCQLVSRLLLGENE